MFFLTYHKVNKAVAGDDFYIVSEAQLTRHFDLLEARSLQNVRIEDLIQTGAAPINRFLLSFDDGTRDHYEIVFPLLQQRRYQGIFFIPTAKLNKPGYLTNGQVQAMAAAGHAIGFHSHEHRRLDLLPSEEVRRQISLSQKIVADIVGAQPVLFVPPGGFVNADIRRIAAELGVKAMRTMRWGYNRRLDLLALETIPINRHTDDRQFQKILASRNAPWLYTGKEVLKRLIPLRSYEWLRGRLFKASKSG